MQILTNSGGGGWDEDDTVGITGGNGGGASANASEENRCRWNIIIWITGINNCYKIWRLVVENGTHLTVEPEEPGVGGIFRWRFGTGAQGTSAT